MDVFLLSLLKAKELHNCSERSGGDKTAVCRVKRRAKEPRRPRFSSIGASNKTSTGRDAKQHKLRGGVRTHTERREQIKDTMSEATRTNKTWIFKDPAVATTAETCRGRTRSKTAVLQLCVVPPAKATLPRVVTQEI